MLLNVGFLGELSEEKLEEVLLGDILKACSWGNLSELWNWSWFSDWFWLGNSNFDFLWLWNHRCLDSWIVIWGTGNDLRNWEKWSTNLELSWVDVLLVVSSAKKRLSHRMWCLWQLVGGDVVSLFDDFWWLVLDLSLNLRISDGFKKLGNLREGVFKLTLLVLLDLLFCGDANLLHDPLTLLS